eukprot:1185248-Rhodomonas_salina.1
MSCSMGKRLTGTGIREWRSSRWDLFTFSLSHISIQQQLEPKLWTCTRTGAKRLTRRKDDIPDGVINPCWNYIDPSALPRSCRYVNDPPTQKMLLAYRNAQCKVYNCLNWEFGKACPNIVWQ